MSLGGEYLLKWFSSDEDGSPLEQQNLPSDLDMLPAKLKKLKTPEEVETTLTNYLQNHPVLYEQILQFEVIYLKPFLKKLKEDGWMVKPVLLMDFFDSQVIIYTVLCSRGGTPNYY